MDNNGIKNELDEIRTMIGMKQDRIKPVVWIPLALWILTTTFSGTWFLSSINVKMETVQVAIQAFGKDRYYGTDAARDLQLRDQRMDFLQDQIDRLGIDIEKSKKGK